MSGSFQKKSKSKVVSIPGTKLSMRNSLLLTSTGISSLDKYLGGGLPVGTIILVEEDKYRRYAQTIARSFVAEGVACGHFVHIISDNLDLLNNIPQQTKKSQISSDCKEDKSTNEEELKIAWRYGNKTVSNDNNEFAHSFNYSMKLNHKDLPVDKITMGNIKNNTANDCIDSIKSIIRDKNVGVGVGSHSNLLRIVISLMPHLDWDKTKFLSLLMRVARSSFCSIMVTVPSTDGPSELIASLNNISDYSIKVVSHQDNDSETDSSYSQYDGILRIKKITALNSMVKPAQCRELGFKLSKTNFKLELLHLPPSLSETVSRTSSSNCNFDF